MPITNGYATLAQLQRRLNMSGTTDNDLLEEAIQSASREIDKHCGRRFYKDTSTTVRVYGYGRVIGKGIASDCLAFVDDLWDTASLVVKTDTAGDGTYATTWSASDYELRPLNGVVDGESGWPYWEIHAVGAQRFPWAGYAQRAPLQVTAKWGWTAVPDPVYQACLILAQANYKLKDASFGAVGVADLGVVTVTQVPAAAKKLAPYRTGAAVVMVA